MGVYHRMTTMRIPLVLWLCSILCCFWIFLCFNISVASAHCLEDQKSLLLQLKNELSFNESSSTKLVLWNQSLDCCGWIGVSCDEKGHVIDLDLSEELISGGFDNSSSIFGFRYLQRLNLASNNFNSVIPTEFHRLKNLNYLNLSYAGFMGQIPLEISQLTRLVTLDISSLSYYTGLELKLENPDLRMLIQNLTNIRKLYLDGITISSQGKEWCNALLSLPNLQELSMSGCNLSGPIDSSLARLKNLSVIRLGQNNLSATVPEIFGNFSNLITLHLGSCGLSGNFPERIFQIKTLNFIDISFNTNLQGSFPDFPVNGSLQTLVVSNTNFTGVLPNSIGNLGNLSKLDLSSSNLYGTLPDSISQLTELTYFDLSNNNFVGSIPSFGRAKKLTHIDLSDNALSGVISSSSGGVFEGLKSLVSINLHNNSINGSIPSSLFAFPNLQIIKLSFNKFSKLEGFSNVSNTVLDTLYLSSNNLTGPVPESIFQLRRLSVLQLSSNNFNGKILLGMIAELKNLTTLDLSNNNLSINVDDVSNAQFSSFPNMSSLKLASCNLKTFPAFLRNQSKLANLDLSDNQIQGKIPSWIWILDLIILNLSQNSLTDFERPIQYPNSSLLVLDLHSNQLQGSIPFFPKSATYLDYSNNTFSSVVPYDIGDYLSVTIFLSLSYNSFNGSIPHSVCNASSLLVLDLSHNNFSGKIPPCLMTMSETLGVLTLRENNLTGYIPDNFPILCALRTLDLHGNKLDGPIPKSLANCNTLEVLDLGKNQIFDVFPCLLKNITTLRVLVLRQNKFQGHIGCSNIEVIWQMLQIADLAFNNFTGKLPRKYFGTWEGMMPDEAQTLQFTISGDIYYRDSVVVTSKGMQLKLVKILTVFTAMDFSSNHLEGAIPEEMMNFKALYILNLSNNALTGRIPSSIENLRNLESLDLSNNALSANIPAQITMLSFLSFLDVSFNNLVGNIPTGTQIQSFPESSFIGNKGLCGPPLIQSCKNDSVVEGVSQPSKSSVNWNFISVELGFAFGIGTFTLVIVFWKAWRIWYWENVDDLLCIMFPRHLHLEYERHGGKMYRTLWWKAH